MDYMDYNGTVLFDLVEIVNKLEKQINPPKVEKKTKGQRRRDAYAAKLERAGHAYNN